MSYTSHYANYWSSPVLRMAVNECVLVAAYDANMPRKAAKDNGIRPVQPDWFLPEWMRSLKVSQAKLAKSLGIAGSTMHGIYHGRTSYYRDLLNQVAGALNVEPYELLMPPQLASAFKQFRNSADEVSAAAREAEQANAPVRMLSKENQERRKRLAEKRRKSGTNG